jgi:hypothetical protein
MAVAPSEETDMTDHVETCSNVVAPSPVERPDCTPEQLAEMRYLRALDDLVSDAAEGKRLQTLADTLAWTIARIAAGCGVGATGDMLRRVGDYICTFETRRQAEEEARQAQQEGRLPN